MTKISVLTLAVLLASSSLAVAQSSGGLAVDTKNGSGAAAVNGPVIGGDFNAKVSTGTVKSNAKGEGAIARNVVGSMTDGSVGGSVRTEVTTGDIEANAEGEKACAENIIGSVGRSACVGK